MDKVVTPLERRLREDSVAKEAATPEAKSPVAVPIGLPERIEYTRTKTVSIRPEVLERNRIVSTRNDAHTDAYRMLRTQVLLQMRENGWRTLGITSPSPGAGKSTVALNLAISLALEVDHTALLIDADLRRPRVRELLELPSGPGVSDHLVDGTPISDLLIHPGIGHLLILPGGRPVANSSELLRSPMMANMVRELRDRYADRIVVFDIPPVLVGADALALTPALDAALLVVEELETPRKEVQRACDLLANANLLGVVLNKSHEIRLPEPRKASLWARLLGRR